MNNTTRILAVSLLAVVGGTLGWILTPSEAEVRQASLTLVEPSTEARDSSSPVDLDAVPATDDRLAAPDASAPGRSAASAERRTTPDQLELRQALAAAEGRHMEAIEAAFAALRESRGPGCIEGWRDASGEVRLDSPAPPQPHLVRVYDLPAESGFDSASPSSDPSGKGATQGPARVRVLAVHLTQANAPQVLELQAEAERLRRRLR